MSQESTKKQPYDSRNMFIDKWKEDDMEEFVEQNKRRSKRPRMRGWSW